MLREKLLLLGEIELKVKMEKNLITTELAKFKEEIYLVQSDVKSAYYERSVNRLHELIVLYPDRAEPFYELGQLSYNFWKNDAAESYYIRALRADPEYFPTYTQYALILIKEQRFDEAEALLEQSKRLHTREDADIAFYFGMLFQHKGDLDKAVEMYQESIRLSINVSQIELGQKFMRACKDLRGWE